MGGEWWVVLLTNLSNLVRLGGSTKERPSRAWGDWEGEGGVGITMSPNDVGSYESKQSPCEMQMEECTTHLARSTSDGSADLSLLFWMYAEFKL